MGSEWLREVIRFIVVGQIYPGWLLKKPLLGVVEQDRMGYYLISNEELVLYAIGATEEEALEDFKGALIDNYEYLEAQAGEDPDLARLFQEYQKYLKRSDPLVV
jgi:hypothetical protein